MYTNCALSFFFLIYSQAFRKIYYKDAIVVELDDREDGPQIQAILGQMTGASTVSICFLTSFIGYVLEVERWWRAIIYIL